MPFTFAKNQRKQSAFLAYSFMMNYNPALFYTLNLTQLEAKQCQFLLKQFKA
ncbi:hypothetical protein F544_5370 [Bibersteinia trehalosi USDA-ARS-USMARC-190]|nr:hypothetical protein F544_5370 [Bibersteinia trehalosi USDA-ARS-USMARC-190]